MRVWHINLWGLGGHSVHNIQHGWPRPPPDHKKKKSPILEGWLGSSHAVLFLGAPDSPVDTGSLVSSSLGSGQGVRGHCPPMYWGQPISKGSQIPRTPISWLQLAQKLKFTCPLRITVDPYLLEAATFKTKQNKQKNPALFWNMGSFSRSCKVVTESCHIVFFQLPSDNILHSQKWWSESGNWLW